MLDRIEKIEIILNRKNVDEMDFLNEFDKLIKNTYKTKVSQLKTKDEFQDLYNDGVIILFECLDKFNTELKKVKFSTFFVNNFKFWLNNNFKTIYTGVKCNSRAMQKQRNLYKIAQLELENGNVNKANDLYNTANNITGKFIDLNKESSVSMDDIIDLIASPDNNYNYDCEILHYIINHHLPSEDADLIKKIFGINTPKIPISNLAEELQLERTTIFRKKVKILKIIKQELIKYDI